ncbi:hypothetical protein TrVE_jg12840 [Triparma verrucosa]|uniref:Uncharacterized protein n=1 Tax=Triparma verrucosa TaxID=1606542 RepID=A0A9W7F9G5_9STRA|nr:hypothetical protein TrVE_jg12840 [Triparma verrucosa]
MRRSSAFSRRRSRPLMSYNPTLPQGSPEASPPPPASTSSTTGSATKAPATVQYSPPPQSASKSASSENDGNATATAVRTIEKKVRKNVLSQAWETMNPPLSTTERIARIAKSAQDLEASNSNSSRGSDDDAEVDSRSKSVRSAQEDADEDEGGSYGSGEGGVRAREERTAEAEINPQHESEKPVAGTPRTSNYPNPSNEPETPYTVGTSNANADADTYNDNDTNRDPQTSRRPSHRALHMSDMIVAGANCMVEPVNPNQPKSTMKLNTMKMSSLHSPAPLPSSRKSFANQTMSARNATGVFKEERESLVGDLTSLWQQIDFLEAQLDKVNKKNLTSSSHHAKIVEKLAMSLRETKQENEELKSKLLVDQDAINELSREITLSKAEQRRLHHLANTKFLSEHKTERRFAQQAADKLSDLNLKKNQSDARGDELAVTIVDMRRQFQKKEGSLLSEINALKSRIMQLEQEVQTSSQAHEGAHSRNQANLSKNDSMINDLNSLQEAKRVLSKIKERDDAEMNRLRNQLVQIQEGNDRAMSEWKDRCLKAEQKEKIASDHLIAREKELDKLREKIASAVNDAEGEVRVSRAEAEALKERCISLEEQNEALVDRYREAETIMRREGIRFDGTMKRLVDEMRARDDLGREFLEERRLLNKQWEKREKEIIMALKREARKAELKEEQIKEKGEEITKLKETLEELQAMASDERRGIKRDAISPINTNPMGRSLPGPFLPSELEEKIIILEHENSTLRSENTRLLSGLGKYQEDELKREEEFVDAKPKTGSIRKRNSMVGLLSTTKVSLAASPDSATSSVEADDLLSEFRSGGINRMTSEVRKMVSESGKILNKIQDLEKSGVDPNESTATTAFMSPYLYDDP